MIGKPSIKCLPPTRLIKSIKHEHSCKILYVILLSKIPRTYAWTSEARSQISSDIVDPDQQPRMPLVTMNYRFLVPMPPGMIATTQVN